MKSTLEKRKETEQKKDSMKDNTKLQMKKLSREYHHGFIDRLEYQAKRSELIDRFAMTSNGDDTVQVVAKRRDFAVRALSSESDILDLAEALSVSNKEGVVLPGIRKELSELEQKQKIARIKKELLLVFSGVMMAAAGYLFYLMTSH